MVTIFTTISDVRQYVRAQLQNYAIPSEQSTAVERLIELVRTDPGFAYGSDMDDLLDRIWSESGENWPV